MKNGLEQLTADPCIFINQLKDTAMYLALYVDDAPWLKWLVRWIAEREVRGSNPREHQKVFHGPTSRECLTNVRE